MLLLVGLAACGGIPPPNPIPTPTPTPTPPPPAFQTLKVQGNRIVRADGTDPRILGTIIGCHLDGVLGWPLVCTESLDEIKAAGLNWTHVRTGPFTAEAEAPEFAFYEKAPGGGYDLTQIRQAFQARLRATAQAALDRGIYLEVDLPVDRWPVQHHVSPWPNGLDMFQRAPEAVHEAAIRAVVTTLCDLPNVIFQAGNEAFKSDSEAFTARVIQIVRECPTPHLVGVNSEVGRSLGDFYVIHQSEAPPPYARPIEVNEFGQDISPDQVINNAVAADKTGGYYHYWRGSHSADEWKATMRELAKIREGHPPTPTPGCEIPTTDVPQVTPRPAGGTARGDLTAMVQANVKEANPSLFDADGNLAGWPSDGASQSAFAQRYFNPLVAHLRGLGYCASPWEDSIAWGKPEWGFYEEWHVLAFGKGTPIIGANAYRFSWQFPGGTPVPPTATCPIPAPGTNWFGELKPGPGQQVRLTPHVGNPTHTENQPWVGCGTSRCPLACEKGDVACACQHALFGDPAWATSGGVCQIIPQTDSTMNVKVASGSCALFVRGTAGAPQLGPWEVSATSPACHVGTNGLCQ